MDAIDLDGQSIIETDIVYYREIIRQQGWILLTNLPADFDELNFCDRFGKLMPQYGNKLRWDVKADPEIINSHCSLGILEVSPHTEFYEGENDPPNYLALWCLQPASCGGGKIAIADSYTFLKTLSRDDRDYLDKTGYLYRSEAGIMQLGYGRETHHTVVEQSRSKKDIFRFNLTGMEGGDRQFLDSFRQKFLEFYRENCLEFLQPKNSLLIWDNFRMVHSRSSSFQDLSRHLVRFWFR